MSKIEIVGLDTFRRALNSLPSEVRPPVLRDLARKPATRAANEARRLQPIGNTGQTARTIGIQKVRNSKQPYVEVGYRGRSLGNIYTSGETITRHGRGTIKGFPQLFHRAGDLVLSSALSEMKIDITKVLVRGMRKYGYR